MCLTLGQLLIIESGVIFYFLFLNEMFNEYKLIISYKSYVMYYLNVCLTSLNYNLHFTKQVHDHIFVTRNYENRKIKYL